MDELQEQQTGPVNPYAQTFFWIWGLALLALAGFRADNPSYREQLDSWHRQRVESLKGENGWLNLAGLLWLKEGTNRAGTDPGNELTFPSGKAPEQLGTFRLANGAVQFEAAPGAVVQADGQPVLATRTVFSPDLTKPVTLSHGSLRWFVIKRGNRYALRLRDLASPLLTDFKGIDRFPVNESFRVSARLEQSTEARTIPILDVTGQTAQQPLAGTLVFTLDGKTQRLDAIGEGDKLFILFGDATNTHDTYGSGRFLYVDKPGADGQTTIDFNQSINPPCAFTPYATCPLPPKQNRLALAIRAGEKRYGDH
ncbi:DUF1684 domain-containing protein [Fibrella forsythiae]|uniref:DUF1684 domain-containing protein n=1 Tax=Fibrella forsythiae TaxID=2817061 RepID=A0ABS3JPX6_9BACT|nr:DUF1684 domain-containing protein [Fibrella forsythiae]MBO0951538.1 DUF1684 domain-containing protein [Fibrella forsythiae]